MGAAWQAVLQGSVSAAAARTLESGAVFERWIKTGQWLDAGTAAAVDAAPVTGGGGGNLGRDDALAITRAVLSDAGTQCAPVHPPHSELLHRHCYTCPTVINVSHFGIRKVHPPLNMLIITGRGAGGCVLSAM